MQNCILENQITKQENQNHVLEIWNIILEKQTYTLLMHSLIYGWVKWVEIINSNKPEHSFEKQE